MCREVGQLLQDTIKSKTSRPGYDVGGMGDGWVAGAPGWREGLKVRTNVCARRVGSLVRHCPSLSSSWVTTSLRDYVITDDYYLAREVTVPIRA